MTWTKAAACDTGGCLEIELDGNTVRIRESANPDVEVVTTLASWQAWLDQARADERAAIVAAIRADHDTHPWSSYRQPQIADMIERGERAAPAPITRHASPGCACGVNGAGERFVDPICARHTEQAVATALDQEADRGR